MKKISTRLKVNNTEDKKVLPRSKTIDKNLL